MCYTARMEEANPLGSEPPPKRVKPGCLTRLLQALGLFLGLVLMLAGLAFLTPRGLPAGAHGQLTACRSNCKNIATALEMYASDNKGLYPTSLDRLIRGNYLKLIPTCPSADKMTYKNYQVSTSPDCFSFACCGSHHRKAYASDEVVNFPRYHAEKGVIEP